MRIGIYGCLFQFILEFTGSDEWQSRSWFSEKHCQVENKGSPITAVVCSTSGYHPFAILDHAANKLVRLPDKSRYIHINLTRLELHLNSHLRVSRPPPSKLSSQMGLVASLIQFKCTKPEDASSNPARDNEFFAVLCSVKLIRI